MNNKIITPLYKRLIILIPAYGFCTAGYLITNAINSNRAWYWNPSFSFENYIPFIPYFIFMYVVLFFAMFALGFVCKYEDEYIPLAKALILLSIIHFIIFLLIPVKATFRPELTGSGITYFVTKLIFDIDNPTNCFPSLHVAYPLTVALVTRRLRTPYMIIAVMLGISVILVKQHYFADILGAIVTSCFVLFITNKYFRHE